MFVFFYILSQMSTIKLRSSDGKIFETDIQIAKCSGTIKDMLEACDEDENAIVPLPKVTSPILKKVLEWADYHKDDAEPLEDADNKVKRNDDISTWDIEFLKVNESTLYELILAANYLDVKGLMDVTCKVVANKIKGKNADEICKEFKIEKDFPPVEEELVSKENEPCDEK